MSNNNIKQFGVWMDSQHATIIGRDENNEGEFKVLGHEKYSGVPGNSSENAEHNHEVTLRTKFFKEITSHMQNVDELHVTGTGVVQEQFINYLAETPQYKNVKTSECTTNKMSDEDTVAHISNKFN
jgi:stalled ribosome rescue protein Dom34